MVEFLAAHQLNLMLFLCGICAIIAFFARISSSMSRRRKRILMFLEISSFFLLLADRFAYIYRGDVSVTGYYMVRICNFLVFFLTLASLELYNLYMSDLLVHDLHLKKIPRRIYAGHFLTSVGMILVILSQFTGLYYTFDDQNRYQRSPLFFVCYIIPIAVLLVLFSAVLQYGVALNRGVFISLLLFAMMPIIASGAQLFFYGLSLTNMTIVAMGVLLYVFSLIDMNQTAERVHRQELEYLEEKKESMSMLFGQTAAALAGAIDDGKTHVKGHSGRVARYAREIARLAGKDEEECEQVYFAALLHDVGKLRIPDAVLLKEGERTQEEEALFRDHTREGDQILSRISEYSYLRIGAHYHHERYDGTGYPEQLKGKEIPELARIITAADAYDSMTSRTAFRNPLPQAKVREEFLKEAGRRFDPDFAKVVLQMIDNDPEYLLKDTGEGTDGMWKNELRCTSYRSEISTGIPLSQNLSRIHLRFQAEQETKEGFNGAALILFDSLDGCVHRTAQMIRENGYVEYGEVWFDGHFICTRARNLEVSSQKLAQPIALPLSFQTGTGISYEIEAGRFADHVKIVIRGNGQEITAIAALPDTNRYIYLALTGENCKITDIAAEETGVSLKEGDIPRIAEEIRYTDRLESDLKNIQIDGKREKYTESVPVRDGMRLLFHTMSLPTAELVWHCPYIVLFTSEDKTVGGKGYQEYVLIRLDGEIEEPENGTDNKMLVTKNDAFESWDTWKMRNRKGMECEVIFKKKGGKVTVFTENAGISIKCTTTPEKGGGEIYAALTGDRCALTDIRVD